MRKIGLPKLDPGKVVWTLDLIAQEIVFYAKCAGETVERFRESMQIWVEEQTEELQRKVRRLEAEIGAIVQLLDVQKPGDLEVTLLPMDGRDERIAKYERHMHTMLTSTLHEMERLRALCDGEYVAPPVVADVMLTLDSSD